MTDTRFQPVTEYAILADRLEKKYAAGEISINQVAKEACAALRSATPAASWTGAGALDRICSEAVSPLNSIQFIALLEVLEECAECVQGELNVRAHNLLDYHRDHDTASALALLSEAAAVGRPHPEVVAAVQEAITKHPFWKPGLGSSGFAFGLANTAIDAYLAALPSEAIGREPDVIEAGAQALANDVWHPPQLLKQLSNFDANKFRRQARLVLEAAGRDALDCGTIWALTKQVLFYQEQLQAMGWSEEGTPSVMRPSEAIGPEEVREQCAKIADRYREQKAAIDSAPGRDAACVMIAKDIRSLEVSRPNGNTP